MSEEDRIDFVLSEGEARFLDEQAIGNIETIDDWQDEIVDYNK